jgi:hypothetical protein
MKPKAGVSGVKRNWITPFQVHATSARSAGDLRRSENELSLETSCVPLCWPPFCWPQPRMPGHPSCLFSFVSPFLNE